MARCAGERGEGALVEHVGHQAHVLDHGDVVAVADRHARRLLAPVLQGVEAEVGQVGDGLAGGVDAEDAARLLRRVVVGVPGRDGDVGDGFAHGPHPRTPDPPASTTPRRGPRQRQAYHANR